MEHLKGPFGLEAVMSSDLHNIRHINANIGDGKPYAAIASVRYRNELTLEENLATAELLRSAPELRDQNLQLQRALKESIGFMEAWQLHLSDSGKNEAAMTVAVALENARQALTGHGKRGETWQP